MSRISRSTVTLSVLGVLCVLALVLGVAGLISPLPDEPLVKDPPPSCEMRTVRAGTTVKSDEVTVSVYNAGTRGGLASKTMSALLDRGFERGDSDNAPEDANVRRVQIWAQDDNAVARLVARQFGPGTKVLTGKPDLGLGVVVVVGNDYTKLAKAPTSVVVKERTSFCSPSVTGVDPSL